jgi:NAD(P)-dependent dehydrogenase (short-subunit alcohol dehydrogenase family)
MALSHDKNPLHWDEAYSRRTQFGRPVVYGMCSVLVSLGTWAAGKAFQLNSIRGQFLKPFFVGVPYAVKIEEKAEKVEIRTFKGNQLHAWIRFSYSQSGSGRQQRRETPSNQEFQPRSEASGWKSCSEKTADLREAVSYGPNLSAAQDLQTHFGLNVAQFPAEQLNALLWSSYYIGMEVPGKQALFTDFEFSFRPADGETFRLCDLKADFDRQYNRVTISGRGSGISSFQLNAFSRPMPVEYPIESVRKQVPASLKLKGKTVFISGACRGFGAVLSKVFALQGANLALNYRSGQKEARFLQDELSPMTENVMLVQGDVVRSDNCDRMVAEVMSRFSKVDFLICNASPHLVTSNFLAQSPAEFMAALQGFVAVTSGLLHSFLPKLEAGATIIYVSTIATQHPEKQYGHYVAGKSAVEGLIRVLAKEFKALRFVIVRPPRMLTDLTNLPYDPTNPLSAVDVAVRMLQHLDSLEPAANLFELNL